MALEVLEGRGSASPSSSDVPKAVPSTLLFIFTNTLKCSDDEAEVQGDYVTIPRSRGMVELAEH